MSDDPYRAPLTESPPTKRTVFLMRIAALTVLLWGIVDIVLADTWPERILEVTLVGALITVFLRGASQFEEHKSGGTDESGSSELERS